MPTTRVYNMSTSSTCYIAPASNYALLFGCVSCMYDRPHTRAVCCITRAAAITLDQYQYCVYVHVNVVLTCKTATAFVKRYSVQSDYNKLLEC
jgi:hypothetical protein